MRGKHEVRKTSPVRKGRGRRSERRIKAKSLIITALALALICATAVSGTLAYLYTRSETVQNIFVPGEADCEVRESFNGHTKTDVKIENTGNVPAYIRVKLLPYWYDKSGNNVVSKSEWEMHFNKGADWVKGSDGIWYYTRPVNPGEYTSVLIDSIQLGVDNVTLYNQALEIIASCIQAQPDDAVLAAWSGANGSVIGVNSGVLSIQGG